MVEAVDQKPLLEADAARVEEAGVQAGGHTGRVRVVRAGRRARRHAVRFTPVFHSDHKKRVARRRGDQSLRRRRRLHAGCPRPPGPARAPPTTMTSFFDAIAAGDYDEVETHLNAGADPNAPGPANLPPLHAAVAASEGELIRLLASRGADLERRELAVGAVLPREHVVAVARVRQPV